MLVVYKQISSSLKEKNHGGLIADVWRSERLPETFRCVSY